MASKKNKAVIIGAGNVGSTIAYTLAIKSTVSEVVLVDADNKKAEGHAADIRHAMMYLKTSSVSAGDYSEVEDASYVVITAGSKQKPGETRLDLLGRNASITGSILDSMKPYLSDQIIIFVSNPVDVLTYFAANYLDYDKRKIFGTGTALDTARLRYLLGEKLKINPKNVHAFVVGEHGDSSVPLYDSATVIGRPLKEMDISDDELDQIYKDTRDAAYRVVEAKGATYFAIGLVTAEIVQAIHHNQQRVFALSTYLNDFHGISDVCLSIPCIVGSDGIEHPVDVSFSDKELSGLKESADRLKTAMSEIKM